MYLKLNNNLVFDNKIYYNLEKIGFLSLVATAIEAFMKSSLCNNI